MAVVGPMPIVEDVCVEADPGQPLRNGRAFVRRQPTVCPAGRDNDASPRPAKAGKRLQVTWRAIIPQRKHKEEFTPGLSRLRIGATAMTKREKIAHLLRRFGLGATQAEIDQLEPLSIDKAAEAIVLFDRLPDDYPMSPWEFSFREKEDADTGPWRFSSYWIANMVTTKRPAREKLALFYHNHFAVSAAKVEDGLMMLQYMETLRDNASKPFPQVLKAIGKDPAMMAWLDMYRSLKGNPNENFAREVLELFTLGEGNFSEADVKEAARAFTGWTFVNLLWESPGTMNKKIEDMVRFERPMSTFCYAEALHDDTPKTILGKTARFNGDSLLEYLALHPITAKRICKRLWEYYATPNPDPKLVERLAKTYVSSQGDVQKVLLAIAKAPEFWDHDCVRQQIKSPIDYMIPVMRQAGAGDYIRSKRGHGVTPTKPVDGKLFELVAGLNWWSLKLGMNLLYPPDVAGWQWHDAWTSSGVMSDRFNFRGVLLWFDEGYFVKRLMEQAVAAKPVSSYALADLTLRTLDVQVPDKSREILAACFEKAGGPKCLEKFDSYRWGLDMFTRALVAASEMQLC